MIFHVPRIVYVRAIPYSIAICNMHHGMCMRYLCGTVHEVEDTHTARMHLYLVMFAEGSPPAHAVGRGVEAGAHGMETGRQLVG